MPDPAATFSVTPAAVAAERFKRDPEGRFVNLDGSGPHPFKAVYQWAVADKLAGRRRKSPARTAVPAVKPDPAALAIPPAPVRARGSPGLDTRAGWCSSAASRC